VNTPPAELSPRELAAARPLYERALAISERALGPDHPTTATIRRTMSDLVI
jgi:hypothetical protein